VSSSAGEIEVAVACIPVMMHDGPERLESDQLFCSGSVQKAEAATLVEGFDENDSIESVGFFWFGTVMTILFVLTLASTSFLPYIKDLGMGYVALGFALIMLLRFKGEADKFYQAVDWDLLAFFAGLFVVIHVMEHAQVLHLIGKGLQAMIQLGPIVGGGLVLVASSVFSSVTDNIPLATMLAKILSNLNTPSSSGLWWSVIFGANLGGNLTPIGSASTLVAVTIIHKQGLRLSFSAFVKTAIPFAVMHIALATCYVLLFLR
ncbi:MAG: SLC13 family permease, partial [Myxococcota bacterium]